MNGAIYEATFNFFFKLRYQKTYDAILSTPLGPGDVALGEVAWALFRGALYATAFVIIAALLGLIISPWAILAIPVALLIGFAFGAVGHGRHVVLPELAGLRPRSSSSSCRCSCSRARSSRSRPIRRRSQLVVQLTPL